MKSEPIWRISSWFDTGLIAASFPGMQCRSESGFHCHPRLLHWSQSPALSEKHWRTASLGRAESGYRDSPERETGSLYCWTHGKGTCSTSVVLKNSISVTFYFRSCFLSHYLTNRGNTVPFGCYFCSRIILKEAWLQLYDRSVSYIFIKPI